MPKLIDLTGQRFGRLTVIKRGENSRKGEARWICECDCGNKKLIWGCSLRKETTTSCGCHRKEILLKTTHGGNKTRLHSAWRAIKGRTTNKNHKHYKDYGGRGIEICDEWKNDFTVFREWALKNGYEENLTIDRINNNKGYSPDNCRWVDMKKQGANRRSCHYVEYNNEIKTISEWAEQINIKADTLYNRLRLGWSAEKALTTPLKKKK